MLIYPVNPCVLCVKDFDVDFDVDLDLKSAQIRENPWPSLYLSVHKGTLPGVQGAPAASISFSSVAKSTSTKA
jgi:hypothetical protein